MSDHKFQVRSSVLTMIRLITLITFLLKYHPYEVTLAKTLFCRCKWERSIFSEPGYDPFWTHPKRVIVIASEQI